MNLTKHQALNDNIIDLDSHKTIQHSLISPATTLSTYIHVFAQYMPIQVKNRLSKNANRLMQILSVSPDNEYDTNNYSNCIEQVNLILEDMNDVLDEVPDLNVEAQSGISSAIRRLFDILHSNNYHIDTKKVHNTSPITIETTNSFQCLITLLKELDACIFALDESVPLEIVQQLSSYTNSIMQLIFHANTYMSASDYIDFANQVYSIISKMCHLLEDDLSKQPSYSIVLPMVLKIHDVVKYKRHITTGSNNIITAVQNLLSSKELEYGHRSLDFVFTNNTGTSEPTFELLPAIIQLVDHLIDVAIESLGEDYEGLINIKLSWHNLHLLAEISDNDNLIVSNYIGINHLS